MTEDDQEAFAAFHNMLRVMINIDQDELIAAGAMDEEDLDGWISFRENPWRFFIKAGQDTAEAIWSIIRERETVAAERRAARPKVCATCRDDIDNIPAGLLVCPTCGFDGIPF